MKPFLLILCFFSGMAGLIYEVIWNRWLLLLFGSTTLSVSLILAVFMAGLALGSLWMGRVSRRVSSPIMVYGLIEVVIGLYGAFTPDLFGAVEPAYRWIWLWASDFPPALLALRSGLVFVGLIIPTLLMGATLPLLARVFVSMKAHPGSVAGWLYGINTTGAVLGAGLSGFVLLPWLGMQQGLQTAVAINVGIGLGAVWISNKVKDSRKLPASSILNPHRPIHQTISAYALLLCMALSGLAAMIYEVAWTRELVLVLGSSTYAFSLMLAAFLIGIAAGSLAVVRLADQFKQPVLMLAGIEAGIAFLALVGQYGMGRLPEAYLYWYWLMGPSVPTLWIGQLLLAFGLMVGPTLLLGASFPLAVRIINGSEPELGRSVGSVYGMNTLGTVLGALAGGGVLIPLAGLQGTVILGTAISLLAAWVLILNGASLRRSWRLGLSGLCALILFLVFVFMPAWDPIWMSSGFYKEAPAYLNLVGTPSQVRKMVGRYRPLFYKEGAQATVSVVERPSFGVQPHLTLAIDGKVDASTGADMSTQVLSGHLPLMLAERMDKVLVVGYASGVTVGSVLLYPVQELVAAEIEPAVIEGSHYFDSYNNRPLEDPRVRLVLDDGRHYLGLTPERFDAVISEPSNPWMSGPSRLFTYEFFELSRKHLNVGGVMAQWIQMYGMSPDMLKAVIRTFHNVFPYMLIFQTAQADLLLIGSEKPVRLDLTRLNKAFSEHDIASDLARIGIDTPWDLLGLLRMGEEDLKTFLGEGILNTDDNGLLEFSAPMFLYIETVDINQHLIEQTMLNMEGPSGLLKYFAISKDDKPQLARVAITLARNFLKKGRQAQTEKLSRISLFLEETAEGYWLLGEINNREGNFVTALHFWEEALQIDPSHSGTLLSMALYYLEQGDFEQAEGFFRRGEKTSNPPPQFWLYYGVNLYYLKQYPGAMELLKEFVRISPDGKEAILAYYYLSKIDAELKDLRGVNYSNGRLIQLLRQLRTSLEQDQRQEELDGLLRLIERHTRQAMFRQTERGLKVLITQYITDPLSHYYKGVSLYFLGYDKEATEELRRVLEILPKGDESSRAHQYLGLIASSLKGTEKQMPSPARL
ncbi:MAG: fused MFS/spermidine synthase [Nitrospirae bacterium]|nr:fused MFS/spermidine synthase [Nitrospirota bacterium]